MMFCILALFSALYATEWHSKSNLARFNAAIEEAGYSRLGFCGYVTVRPPTCSNTSSQDISVPAPQATIAIRNGEFVPKMEYICNNYVSPDSHNIKLSSQLAMQVVEYLEEKAVED